MRTDWEVIVIGAGLAWLAAGAIATNAGFTTLVLDAHVPVAGVHYLQEDSPDDIGKYTADWIATLG